ncbi:hypothetical protein ACQJBY_011490 [Aegilops geniculata]
MDTGDSSAELSGNTPSAPPPVTTSSPLVAPVASAPDAISPSAMTVLPLLPPPAITDAASSSSTTIPSIHNLHNISSLITFKLDVQSDSYSKWRELWRCVLSMYAVEDHVAHYVDPALQTPVWRHTDLTILLLLYATINDSLYEVIRGRSNTAFRAWDRLREFFLANQPAQAVHLSAEFRALTQGDMRVAEYCGRLKALADALADVDEPITDRTLTLQLLRGLSQRYHVIATVLPMQTPFPTFNQARSRLLLEEITKDARDRTDGSTALAIGLSGGSGGSGGGGGGGFPGGGGPASGGDRGKAPADTGSHTRTGNNTRGRGAGRGGPNGGRGQQHLIPGGSTPWMGYFAPWGTPFPPQGRAPWVPPNAAGVLGPRPGNPAHAYPVVYPGAPSSSSHPPPPPSWDQAGLIAAMQNMSMQQQQPGEWYLDSGASSHVTGNPGSSHSDPAHELQ